MLDLDSLFKLSYGMCVVSSQDGDKFGGCIINTVFQVIPEPPMIAVSVNRENLTHEYIEKSGVFTVSILGEQTPMPFIGKFGFRSGRDLDKFKDVKYSIGSTGVPIVLDNAIACIEAKVTQKIDVVTHTIFIAEIVACQNLDGSGHPMTYEYYRDVKHGKTPRTAATYHQKKQENKTTEGVETMKKYKCLVCGYIYDPAVGDPENGIEPGTSFKDLPDSWTCPDCGVGKDQFEPDEN